MTLGLPKCAPVITLDRKHQTNSHPKYLVFSGSPIKSVKREDVRIKIIDFGEGSLLQSQSCR